MSIIGLCLLAGGVMMSALVRETNERAEDGEGLSPIKEKAINISKQMSFDCVEFEAMERILNRLLEDGGYTAGLDKRVGVILPLIKRVGVKTVDQELSKFSRIVPTFRHLQVTFDLFKAEYYDDVDVSYVLEKMQFSRNPKIYAFLRRYYTEDSPTLEGRLYGAVQLLGRLLPANRLRAELRKLLIYRFSDLLTTWRVALDKVNTFRTVLVESPHLEDDVTAWPKFLQLLYKYPMTFIHYVGEGCSWDGEPLEYLYCGMRRILEEEILPEEYHDDLGDIVDKLSETLNDL